MEPLAEKVRSLLQHSFPPPDEVRVRANDGIIGFVISPRFKGLDDIDRQGLVWNALNRDLDAAERREVAIIVALTPKEEAAYSATEIDRRVGSSADGS